MTHCHQCGITGMTSPELMAFGVLFIATLIFIGVHVHGLYELIRNWNRGR